MTRAGSAGSTQALVSASPLEQTAIGILARAPVPGRCKTRLVPAIGAPGAARLQRHLIERTLATACEARTGPVVLFTDGDAQDGWDALARRFDVETRPQRGADLGERMADAMALLLERVGRAVLVGTDCLSLRVPDLREAAAALARARMLFAPAEDGGYVLVGARERHDRVFRDIRWGSAEVMLRTRQRLLEAGWAPGRDWVELPTQWDIDRPADLRRAVETGLLDPHWAER